MHSFWIALRWPFGVLVTGWNYMWRTTPMWRSQRDGAWPQDGPPPVDPALPREGVQLPEDGVGPLFRRRYRASVSGADRDATALMTEVKADPNRVAPGMLAHFVKTTGASEVLAVGDEFTVRMPGPWNGPIRVVEVGPRSFRFVTLDGHLEAGQIEWRAGDEDGALVFEIESWARGGDPLAWFLHDRLPMAKEVQLHMWTWVCERVSKYVGGNLDDGIDIDTLRVELPET
jgi:hypothetical protein